MNETRRLFGEIEVTEPTADARFWDRVARKYARDAIKDMPGYERTLARARDFLKRTDTVLELGCGTGMTALALAPAVTRYIGTDISSEMIAIARERVAVQERGNVEFSVVGSDLTTWPAGEFDAVLAFNVLHLVSERPRFLHQVHTALKPGGLFITKTPCLSEMSRLLRIAVPIAQFFGKAPNVAFLTAGGLARDIAAADFTLVEEARHGSTPKDPRIFIVARSER